MGCLASEEAFSTRNNLISRRRKVRRIRTAYDKKLRRLEKERTRTQNQIRDLGYEDLKPPVQRGYKRLFVLTEETKYSARADFYQNILDKINTVQYSTHKTFKVKKRRIGKWKYQYRNVQELQALDEWSFLKKDFTEEEKCLFYPEEYYYAPLKSYIKKYVFSEPWRYRLRIMPHMITQVQIKDTELEQRYQELEDYLGKDKNVKRLTKMRGSNTYSWKKVLNQKEDVKRYKYNYLKNKSLYELYENYKEENDYEYAT